MTQFFEKDLVISIDGKEELKISVTIEGAGDEDSSNPLRMKVKVIRDYQTVGEENWTIHPGKTLIIDASHIANAGPAATCIAGCVSAMSASLVACLGKAKTRKDVVTCFQKNAPAAIIGGAPCIFACLGI